MARNHESTPNDVPSKKEKNNILHKEKINILHKEKINILHRKSPEKSPIDIKPPKNTQTENDLKKITFHTKKPIDKLASELNTFPPDKSSPSDRRAPKKTSLFQLPGTGEKTSSDCGVWYTFKKGCLNWKGHKNGKVRIERVQHSCHQPLCPECWEEWATRQALNIQRRLNDILTVYPSYVVQHVMISPSKDTPFDDEVSYAKLKRRAHRLAKEVGIIGGFITFHPWRDDPENGAYTEIGPHFHILGVRNKRRFPGKLIKKIFERESIVIKFINKGKPVNFKQLFTKAKYELGHYGVRPRKHPFQWFGKLSNRNITRTLGSRITPLHKRVKTCPDCGQMLRLVERVGGLNPKLDAKMKKVNYEHKDDWVYMDSSLHITSRYPEQCKTPIRAM